MRPASLCLLLFLAGICIAQDTNFPVGPQYLMTNGSPLFARPIATPTLDLGAPLESAPNGATEASGAQISNTPSELQAPDFFRIYYVGPKVKEQEIEISSAQTPSALPASILDVGVAAATDAQSLRETGYGVTVGEAAAFWKTHKAHARQVYTNADLARLHGG